VISCEAIRESVFQYIQAETEVISSRHACIVSLPIRALDGANAEVFIEEVNDGALLVHDGGKTIGHLESSGLLITENRIALLADLARRLGVSLDDGIFKAVAKTNTVQMSALAIGQCCSMALFELLRHVPFSEEEQIRAKVSNEVERWSASSGISVDSDVKVPGTVRPYKIDFVAHSATPIEVNVLIPTYTALASADRYGLQVLDLTATRKRNRTKRLAVLAKPEKWTKPARRVVAKLADEIAEVSLTQSLLPTGITQALDSLAYAA
jgi:hypothetical protein